MQQMEICGSCGCWQSRGGVGVGNASLTGQTKGGWTLATPHAVIKAPSGKTSRVGRGAMNAGLCPNRGHHIPLEPLCGAQQSGGEGTPGQDRRGNTGQRLCLSHSIQSISKTNKHLALRAGSQLVVHLLKASSFAQPQAQLEH